MLLFDDTKALEKALGPEAASVVIRVFERFDTENKKELATKQDLRESETLIRQDLREAEALLRQDLREVEASLKLEILKSKAEMVKWVAGMLVAQAAAIAALVKLL